MTDKPFEQRTKAYRRLCQLMEDERFIEGDEAAIKAVEDAKKEIKALDRARMSPRQQMHADIQEQIDREAQ